MSGVIYRDNPCGLKYIIVIFLIYIKCCRGFWFGFIYYNYSNDKIKKHIACIYIFIIGQGKNAANVMNLVIALLALML